jgi:5,10-methenyltetrahydrofolate synthetase
MPPSLPSSEHTADSSVFRNALRRERLEARLALDEKTLATLSARVESGLDALLAPLPPQTLAFCAPIRKEFDARPLATRLLERGWSITMLVVVAAAAPMIFRRWTPETEMALDRHGIPVPAAGEELIPAIMLLPLVAFDPQGFRLGYGGGYFGRTLAAMVPRPLAIGVGFELARVADSRPGTHDIPLDAMVTEAGIVHLARKGVFDLASAGNSGNHGIV